MLKKERLVFRIESDLFENIKKYNLNWSRTIRAALWAEIEMLKKANKKYHKNCRDVLVEYKGDYE